MTEGGAGRGRVHFLAGSAILALSAPLQVIFSGPDVGIVDVEDFVQLAINDGLKLPTPHGFVQRMSRFFSTPDSAHRVDAAIGAAEGKSPYYALTADAGLDKVRRRGNLGASSVLWNFACAPSPSPRRSSCL